MKRIERHYGFGGRRLEPVCLRFKGLVDTDSASRVNEGRKAAIWRGPRYLVRCLDLKHEAETNVSKLISVDDHGPSTLLFTPQYDEIVKKPAGRDCGDYRSWEVETGRGVGPGDEGISLV